MTPHLHRLSGFSFFSWFLMISGSADRLPWLILAFKDSSHGHCSGPLHLRFRWRKQLLSGPMEQQKAGQLEGSLQVSNQIPLTCFFVNSQYFHDQPTKWVLSPFIWNLYLRLLACVYLQHPDNTPLAQFPCHGGPMIPRLGRGPQWQHSANHRL